MHRLTGLTLLLILTFPARVAPAPRPGSSKASAKSPYKKLAVFARVLAYLESEYVDPIDRDRVIEGAIRGMLRSLDPHTQFFSASEVQRLRALLTGRHIGVGLVVTRRQGTVRVLGAVPGGPAARAGVRRGDVLLRVHGRSIRSLSLAAIQRLLQGRRGTQVVLQLRRGRRIIQVTVKRAVIQANDVLKAPLPGRVGFVRVVRFSHGVARQVRLAIDRLIRAHRGRLAGLVLDLRNNPGGLMDEGVRLADHFLDRGLIVRTLGKRGRLKESEFAHAKHTLPHIPLAVLINRNSASAAEAVAGALKDHRRARVIGERSFGKGSLQSIIPLPDGSRLKLTVARYYRPSGRAIQGKGISPHVWIKDSPRDWQKPRQALSAPAVAVTAPRTRPAWIDRDRALRQALKELTRRRNFPK